MVEQKGQAAGTPEEVKTAAATVTTMINTSATPAKDPSQMTEEEKK